MDGVSGIVTEPVRRAQRSGISGFLKGVGIFKLKFQVES